ncbi:MAG TPA: FUSC family protein, partial [Candidatus Methylacidiphilales bacterium]
LLQPEVDTPRTEELVSERLVIDRLDDLLQHLESALRDWRDISQERWKEHPRLALNFHRDIRAAWINGLRAFIAVGATGAFWIASAWTHGTLALIFVAILMSLFSSLPHPDRVGWRFFKAGLLGVFCALIGKFLILTSSSNFEVLALALGLVFLPMAMLMAKPATSQPALSFAFVFIYIVRPDNLMVYDLSDSINSAIGVLGGVLFGTLSYKLIFPPDPAAARRYVTYRVRYGLELLARQRTVPQFYPWETRMYDRVTRLNDPQNLSGTPTDEWLDAGLSALTLGNEVIRLRQWTAAGEVPAPVAPHLTNVIDAFRRFVAEPQIAFRAVRSERRIIAGLDPGVGHPDRRQWARISGALTESYFYLARNPRLTTAHPAIVVARELPPASVAEPAVSPG